jgi:hypothetical protein
MAKVRLATTSIASVSALVSIDVIPATSPLHLLSAGTRADAPREGLVAANLAASSYIGGLTSLAARGGSVSRCGLQARCTRWSPAQGRMG